MDRGRQSAASDDVDQVALAQIDQSQPECRRVTPRRRADTSVYLRSNRCHDGGARGVLRRRRRPRVPLVVVFLVLFPDKGGEPRLCRP